MLPTKESFATQLEQKEREVLVNMAETHNLSIAEVEVEYAAYKQELNRMMEKVKRAQQQAAMALGARLQAKSRAQNPN